MSAKRYQWADFPNGAGLDAVVLFDADTGEVLGWVTKRPDSRVWSCYAGKPLASTSLNLWTDGHFLAALDTLAAARDCVEKYIAAHPRATDAGAGSRRAANDR